MLVASVRCLLLRLSICLRVQREARECDFRVVVGVIASLAVALHLTNILHKHRLYM